MAGGAKTAGELAAWTRLRSEAALEPALIADVERLGAHGYTIVDARGGDEAALQRAFQQFGGEGVDRCGHRGLPC